MLGRALARPRHGVVRDPALGPGRFAVRVLARASPPCTRRPSRRERAAARRRVRSQPGGAASYQQVGNVSTIAASPRSVARAARRLTRGPIRGRREDVPLGAQPAGSIPRPRSSGRSRRARCRRARALRRANSCGVPGVWDETISVPRVAASRIGVRRGRRVGGTKARVAPRARDGAANVPGRARASWAAWASSVPCAACRDCPWMTSEDGGGARFGPTVRAAGRPQPHRARKPPSAQYGIASCRGPV